MLEETDDVYGGVPAEAKVIWQDKRTIMPRMMMVNMNSVYVCVSGSGAEQPAICRQINPGCA